MSLGIQPPGSSVSAVVTRIDVPRAFIDDSVLTASAITNNINSNINTLSSVHGAGLNTPAGHVSMSAHSKTNSTDSDGQYTGSRPHETDSLQQAQQRDVHSDGEASHSPDQQNNNRDNSRVLSGNNNSMSAVGIVAGSGLAEVGDERVGVGVTLKKDGEGYYLVRELAPGSSAQASGMVGFLMFADVCMYVCMYVRGSSAQALGMVGL